MSFTFVILKVSESKSGRQHVVQNIERVNVIVLNIYRTNLYRMPSLKRVEHSLY